MATKKENAAGKAVEEVKKTAEKAKTTTREIVHTTTAGGKKVEHNITHVEAQSSNAAELHQIQKGNATPFRILAIVLWVQRTVCLIL